jgi:hypothetical protein
MLDFLRLAFFLARRRSHLERAGHNPDEQHSGERIRPVRDGTREERRGEYGRDRRRHRGGHFDDD